MGDAKSPKAGVRAMGAKIEAAEHVGNLAAMPLTFLGYVALAKSIWPAHVHLSGDQVSWPAVVACLLIVVGVMTTAAQYAQYRTRKRMKADNPPGVPVTRNLIAIQCPSSGPVARWAVIRGFAHPSPSIVQVLIEAGKTNDKKWFVMNDVRVSRYEWKARCNFGGENPVTGWDFKVCAVIPTTRLTGPIKEIPADAVRSEIVYVTLDRALADEQLPVNENSN
jgi:hypothetical protein